MAKFGIMPAQDTDISKWIIKRTVRVCCQITNWTYNFQWHCVFGQSCNNLKNLKTTILTVWMPHSGLLNSVLIVAMVQWALQIVPFLLFLPWRRVRKPISQLINFVFLFWGRGKKKYIFQLTLLLCMVSYDKRLETNNLSLDFKS